MKTNSFSKLAVLLLTLMILITVSCKKKISKEDLEFRVGQSVSEFLFEEVVKQYGSLVSRERIGELARIETKVSLIKETENRYIGDAVVEYWTPDQHGGDGPGTKDSEVKLPIIVIVDPDDGSFRWEMQN
jgi:hypothetical protein